jgi:NAD(P)-dependent dehydrogenase (short-subunit alcohol dehydrogenase family)
LLFNGEVAIITGAAQGIGKKISKEFCAEGAKTALFDINEEKGQACAQELIKSGGKARFFKCNVKCIAEIDACVKEVAKYFGKIDILVNNAGILHTTSIEDITEQEWDNIMAINLKSVFFMSQKVIPFFKKQMSGKIVNISSLAGRMGGIANGLGYTASKAGIIGLTYGLANRLAAYNINVNAIAPGTTETDILKAFTLEEVTQLRNSVPLKRLGTTQDIANAAAFLASAKASFITGAVLDVNGGMFVG